MKVAITWVALLMPVVLAAQWESLSPGAGGQIQDIVLDPNTPGRVFYLSDVEGAYRSEDFGKSWRYVAQDLASSYTLCASVEPGNRQRVYLGRAEGISISDDGGLSWINVPSSQVADPIMEIAINPADVREVYAVVSERMRWSDRSRNRFGVRTIYASRDRGCTWQSLIYERRPGLRDTYSVCLHPENPASLFVAGQAGVYQSSNRGLSWVKIDPPGETCDGVSWGAAVSPDGRMIYATYSVAPGRTQLFVRSLVDPQVSARWVNVSLLGGDEPLPGTYWIPRIDPRSTTSTHRLLTAAYDNPPNGLVEFAINIAGSVPVSREWQRVLSWDTQTYGGNHSTPHTADVGWELYWTRPLSWRYTPLSWGGGQRKIWSTKDQTLFVADTLDPRFPFNWEQRYCELVSASENVRTYRGTGTASMVVFDGHAYGNHAMAATADNGLMESWDGGYSWSVDQRPNGNRGSRSNAASYVASRGWTWAFAHVAEGFGADSSTGTLFAKRLSRPAAKADYWTAVAGGPMHLAGLPNNKINPIAPDPHDRNRLYLATVSNDEALGRIFVTDNLPAVLAGKGGFRPISGAEGPVVSSDQDMGLQVDPNDPSWVYAGADEGVIWRAQRRIDGTYTWSRLKAGTRPYAWSHRGDTWIACVVNDDTVELSRDKGLTWQRVLEFGDIAKLRRVVWHEGQRLRVTGLVASGTDLYCSYVMTGGVQRGYGVFRGDVGDNATVSWEDYTADLPFPLPMKARIVRLDCDYLYLATWGHGLWRRPID